MNPAALKQRFLQVFGHLFAPADWPVARREALLASVTYQLLDAGTVLMQEGAICRQLPFVLSGSIRVYKIADTGREITLYRIQAGQSCILSSSCHSGDLSFPAIAVAEIPTAAAFLPADSVSLLMEQSPAFRGFVLQQYAARMAEVIELVEEVAFRHVDQRLHEWLRDHGRESGDGLVNITHRELADHIGSSREVISRILKDWEDRRQVDLGRSSIKLLPNFANMRF